MVSKIGVQQEGLSVGLEVSGIREIQMMLKELPRAVRKKVLMDVFRKASKPLIREAKARTPVSNKKEFATLHRHYTKGKGFHAFKRRHRPGQLKRSIGAIPGRSKEAVLWVGPRTSRRYSTTANDGWYGHFIEFGTVNMAPQPFMRPAYETTKGQMISIIDDFVGDEIVKLMKKHGAR